MAHPTDGELTYGTSLNMLSMVFKLQSSPQGRIPIRTLADALEVHERTITRYVKALAERFTTGDGEPLVDKKRIGNRSYAVIKRDVVTQSAVFNYAAVHVAMQNISAIREPLLGDFGASVKENIREHALQTKPELRTSFERVDDVFCYVPFGPKNYQEREHELGALIQASIDRHECEIEYAPPGRVAEKMLIRPLCIVLYRDGLYLRVEALRDEKWLMRTVALDRIRNVRNQKRAFRRPNGFSPSQIAEDRLGIWVSDRDEIETVRLLFTRDAKQRAAEREWPGQVGGWVETDNGHFELTLNLAVTPEFATWLMTWGEKVQVLAPESLRDRLRDTFANALEHYI